MKDYLVTISKLFVMAIGLAFVVALIIMFGVYVLAMVGVILAIFSVAWILNVKFTVTENGQKVGYYKRSTGFVRNKIQGE